jgi:nucleotide-binding universal stress UspA family protein
LVHVAASPSADILALSVDIGVFEHEIREGIETRLAGEARELMGLVPVTSYLAEGSVEGALLARAKEVGADLIVMGAHGRPALERFFLGSTAERMVRITDRPVLVVPPGVERLGGEGAEKRSLRIMVAVDGRPASSGGVELVRRLRSGMACDVTFLRLYWPTEEYLRLGLTGSRDLAAPDPEVVADLERALRLRIGVLLGAGRTSYAIEPTWGDPASGLFVAASEHDADLIVMGAESRRGLARIAHPPVASRVAKQAFGVPVVFVPAPARDDARREVPGIFTVLVPTDLSPAGNLAVPFAYSMVTAHGGVVELCHVHERPLPSPPYAYDCQEGKLSDGERVRIETELRALVPTDAESHGITTHVTVVDGGKAAEAITQAAERLVVDAIVLGSHGKSSGVGALLGSVSQATVHRARRPVLVIPSNLARDPNER